MSDIDELAAALEGRVPVDTHVNEATVPSGQRPCPICGEAMAVEMQGMVKIDVCPGHGMWLDNGELQAMLDGIRTRPHSTTTIRRRVQRARRDGKISGMLLGAWSLMLD